MRDAAYDDAESAFVWLDVDSDYAAGAHEAAKAERDAGTRLVTPWFQDDEDGEQTDKYVKPFAPQWGWLHGHAAECSNIFIRKEKARMLLCFDTLSHCVGTRKGPAQAELCYLLRFLADEMTMDASYERMCYWLWRFTWEVHYFSGSASSRVAREAQQEKRFLWSAELDDKVELDVASVPAMPTPEDDARRARKDAEERAAIKADEARMDAEAEAREAAERKEERRIRHKAAWAVAQKVAAPEALPVPEPLAGKKRRRE